ncbi:hypothetical protein HPP92_028870 [Vanilla planifolia]|uniref:Uncharacterized protein n=1 Tax=Vanilla planifolia TaxID=51239 RepID=A0A835U2E8_VANPL|nr:hypothetical protein HPP92_028870 [Vanilla planifolia]KAG0446378.1 hypothetical protein HPP92_028859 [Vanilla planifolia]
MASVLISVWLIPGAGSRQEASPYRHKPGSANYGVMDENFDKLIDESHPDEEAIQHTVIQAHNQDMEGDVCKDRGSWCVVGFHPSVAHRSSMPCPRLTEHFSFVGFASSNEDLHAQAHYFLKYSSRVEQCTGGVDSTGETIRNVDHRERKYVKNKRERAKEVSHWFIVTAESKIVSHCTPRAESCRIAARTSMRQMEMKNKN